MKLQNTSLFFTLAIILFSTVNNSAYAEFTVYSPHIEESILELELYNHITVDHRDANDVKRQHILELNYGINEWWSVGLEGEIERERRESYEYTATEFTTQIALTQPNEYWLDIGTRFTYEISEESQHADEFAAILLAQKTIDRYTLIGNLSFGRELGRFRGNDTEFGASAKLSYSYLPELNPGIEYFAGFGSINDLKTYGDQAHRIGPVIDGKLGHGFGYSAGVLAGISHSAEDVVGKFEIEYELPVNW